MKHLTSVDELKDWKQYFEFSKLSLKALEAEAPCFVSKDKLAFEIGGKPWNGHAFLAGKFGELTTKALKKEGFVFREGVCRVQGKDLHVVGISAKLAKEALKTVQKLRIGYAIVVPAGDGGEEHEESPSGAASSASGATNTATSTDGRAERLNQLKRLGSDLDRLLAALDQQPKAS